MQAMPLILASRSRARVGMLRGAGLNFAAIPADLDEDALLADYSIKGGGDAPSAAAMLAQQKALHVSRQYPEALVIGADQILVFEGQILQKAKSEEQALARLKAMSGKSHTMISAICVAREGAMLWQVADSTEMTMHPFVPELLAAYAGAAGDDLIQCAGGYTIEGPGAWLFSEMRGDFFTVLGMPLLKLLHYLNTAHGLRPARKESV